MRRSQGSSPLTRGKLVGGEEHCEDAGLIPAHAGKTRMCGRCTLQCRAHPRSRGENSLSTNGKPAFQGSSPLTRGKRTRGIAPGSSPGLIPAHAGKTDARAARDNRAGAHPRSRGENAERRRGGELLRGSSPLTRGKQNGEWRAENLEGLIPAHAGKTRSRDHRFRHRRAHPRSRGENWSTAKLEVGQAGSSPLTRGKPRGRFELPDLLRLIPAHAGKTLLFHQTIGSTWAHPRSRGENVNAVAGGTKETGSSPLTRGKPHRDRVQRHEGGLIPAHAGKTKACAHSFQLTGAHPRSRGENSRPQAVTPTPGGSSPLTRGKPPSRRMNTMASRLIPAHAGKTLSSLVAARARGAHPRSRGENRSARSAAVSMVGSSPLTRGKHDLRHHDQDRTGLIPAHAGKTRKIKQ